jgi:hypothetical protein
MAKKKITLEKLSSREKILLVSGVCVVLALFCEKLVVARVSKRLRSMSVQIEAAEGEVRGNDRILDMRDGVNLDFEEYSAYVMEVPKGRNPVDAMFTALDEFASLDRLIVVGEMKEMATEPGDFFTEYFVKIEVVGTMPNMIRFLHRVEAAPELLRVEKIELSATGDEKSQKKKATLTISRSVSV